MKKILLNVLTHGDELVGKRVADEISKKYSSLIGKGMNIQIANETAFKAGKRYIDQDLNRVFPGNKKGNTEEKRAAELSSKISTYECVIDVHSTESGAGDMVIITKLDKKTRNILKYLSPKYVLHMTMKPDTSLISQARVGIALEMGSDKDEKTFQKTIKAIERIFSYFKLIPETSSFGFTTEAFDVIAPVPKPEGAALLQKIKNFKQIKTGETYAKEKNGLKIKATEDFHPVIFGSTNYETIFGFRAKRLTL